MAISCHDIITLFEQTIPLKLALKGDSNGLVVGDPNKDVRRMFGTLELTPEVVSYAIAEDQHLIFVHHNPFYFPIPSLIASDPYQKMLMDLVKHDICLYVAHTNLDIVDGGVNDYLYTLFNGVHATILDPLTGLGRYGRLDNPINLTEYAKKVKSATGLPTRLITNNPDKIVQTIAVVSGSGGSYYKSVCAQNVDVLLTGDIDYHLAMLAKLSNTAIIDIGHHAEYVVESIFFEFLSRVNQKLAHKIDVHQVYFTFSPWQNV